MRNPARTTKKAVKQAGKALSVFENSALALEAASAHHLAAADGYTAKADALVAQIEENFEREQLDARVAYDAAIQKAEDDYDKAQRAADANVADGYSKVFALDSQAEDAQEAAHTAQVQADSFRQLLSVA